MAGINIKKGKSVFVSKKDMEQISNFLRCVGFAKKLSPQEEVDLALSSDPRKKEKLIKHNTLFVVSVAKYFKIGAGAMLPIEDILQEAYAGLIIGVEKWDTTKGFRLASYAVRKMSRNIHNAIALYGYPVYLPQNGAILKAKVDNFVRKYEQDNHIAPIFSDIARELGDGDKYKVKNLMIVYRLRDFNIGMEEVFKVWTNNENFMENAVTPLDIFPEDTFSKKEEVKYLKEAFYHDAKIALKIGSIDQKGASVLVLYFGLWDLIDSTNPYKPILDQMKNSSFGSPIHIEDISDALGLTRERVRQIKDHSLKKIRESPTLSRLFDKYREIIGA